MSAERMSQALVCLRGGNVAFFETDNAILHIIYENVALLEIKRGKAIDPKQTKQYLDLLERLVNRKYSLVLNRNVNDATQYISIYEAIEDRRLLSKIAIVWGKLGIDCKEYGTEVCKKKLSVFEHIDDAIAWARVVN